MTDYTNVGGQRVRELGEVFPYAPVSDVTLEELKEYSGYLLRAYYNFEDYIQLNEHLLCACCCCLVAQSCLTLCDPMDCV